MLLHEAVDTNGGGNKQLPDSCYCASHHSTEEKRGETFPIIVNSTFVTALDLWRSLVVGVCVPVFLEINWRALQFRIKHSRKTADFISNNVNYQLHSTHSCFYNIYTHILYIKEAADDT